MYYYLITTDDAIIEKQTDRRYELSDFYELIDCDCIQHVMTDNGYDMILDDEGKLKSKPINLIATRLYNNPYDFIVGDVLICTNEVVNDIGERDMCGFPERKMEEIKRLVLGY